MTFHQAIKTTTQLPYADFGPKNPRVDYLLLGRRMYQMEALTMQHCISSHRLRPTIVMIFFILLVSGCAVPSPGRAKTDAAMMVTNDTNGYVKIILLSPLGENLGIGEGAKPFSEGGTGGSSCCTMVPTVGQNVHFNLCVNAFFNVSEQYKAYSSDAILKGTASTDPNPHSYLIVRIFPYHEIEAELVPGDDPRGEENPRVDQLLIGQHVMRKLGD